MFEQLFESSRKTDLLPDTGIIFVTHATHYLSRVDKIMVLDRGFPVFVGSWDELQSRKETDPTLFERISLATQEIEEEADDDTDGARPKEKEGTSADAASEMKALMTGKGIGQNLSLDEI